MTPVRRTREVRADGVVWRVREASRAVDGRSRTDLLFETEGLARRVREYPEQWYLLPDEALAALSRGR